MTTLAEEMLYTKNPAIEKIKTRQRVAILTATPLFVYS